MSAKFFKYILKRILLGIITYLVVVTVTFIIIQLVPGDPFVKEGHQSAQQIARQKEIYGLDKPLFIQYLRYVKCAFTFNFGYSFKYKGALVSDKIFDSFPTSLAIGAIAAVIALIIGVILGVIAALNQNKLFDRTIMVLTTASVAMPSFVICLILLYLFGVKWKLLPTAQLSNTTPQCFILPVVALTIYPSAYITRLMRSSTLDVLNQDYIRTAKAKGLKSGKILFKHAIRNSVNPVITYFGPMFASIITGSLIVEDAFSIKGIGSLFTNSITNRDYPLIMGTTCFLALLLIVFTLLSDILYKVVNPRVDFD